MQFKVILDALHKTNLEDFPIETFPQIKDFKCSFDSEKIPESLKQTYFSTTLKDYLTLLNSDYTFAERNLKAKLTIEKLKDYKNSLKDLFNLQSLNLCIDNKIDNFLDNLCTDNDKLKENEIQCFLLESSIQLYKEVIQHSMK
jgi:hypothetical protein